METAADHNSVQKTQWSTAGVERRFVTVSKEKEEICHKAFFAYMR